jgi:hypothetical protein
VVVGRNERENEALARFAEGRVRIDPIDAMGPTALVEGDPAENEVALAAGLAARYCDHRPGETLRMRIVEGGDERELTVEPLSPSDARIVKWRLGD